MNQPTLRKLGPAYGSKTSSRLDLVKLNIERHGGTRSPWCKSWKGHIDRSIRASARSLGCEGAYGCGLLRLPEVQLACNFKLMRTPGGWRTRSSGGRIGEVAAA